MTPREVVDNHNLMAMLTKKVDGVGTDVSGAAGNKYESHVLKCKALRSEGYRRELHF